MVTATTAGPVRTGRVRARRPTCRPRAARWRGTPCAKSRAVAHRSTWCTQADGTTDPTDPADPAGAERQCFTYDRRGQLATARTAPGSGQVADTQTACAAGGDWHAGYAPYSSTYTFDALHRMVTATLARAITTGTGSGTDQSQTLDYTYSPGGVNPQHGPVSVSGMGTGGGGDLQVAYDPAGTGRVVSTGQDGGPTGSTRTLAYDWAGRIATVTRDTTSGTTGTSTPGGSVPGQAGTSASFTYDAAGGLWRRVDATGTTYYLGGAGGGGDQLFVPVGAQGAASVRRTRSYTAADGVVAVTVTDAGTAGSGALLSGSWVVNDAQSTPALDVDWASGALTRRLADPYGAVRNGRALTVAGTGDGDSPTGGTGTLTQPGTGGVSLAGFATRPGQVGFLGKTEDPTSSLVLLGPRGYDPTLGIFLQPDPLLAPGDPASAAAYQYAGANPVAFSDPTGLMLEAMIGGSAYSNSGSTSSAENRTERAVRDETDAAVRYIQAHGVENRLHDTVGTPAGYASYLQFSDYRLEHSVLGYVSADVLKAGFARRSPVTCMRILCGTADSRRSPSACPAITTSTSGHGRRHLPTSAPSWRPWWRHEAWPARWQYADQRKQLPQEPYRMKGSTWCVTVQVRCMSASLATSQLDWGSMCLGASSLKLR